jgi:hypothetical protein
MARLLLRANGVLAESWCPLDPAPPYVPPDRWDAPHVNHRFAEALGILLKLPFGPLGPRTITNVWPKYRLEWDDLLAQVADGGDAAEQARQERNTVRIPPSSHEISYMEICLAWPGNHLRNESDLAHAFNICAFATARELSVEDVIQRGKHAGVRSPSAWHELALDAARRIAAGLRIAGAAVF